VFTCIYSLYNTLGFPKIGVSKVYLEVRKVGKAITLDLIIELSNYSSILLLGILSIVDIITRGLSHA
jgi:hypothetical protein